MFFFPFFVWQAYFVWFSLGFIADRIFHFYLAHYLELCVWSVIVYAGMNDSNEFWGSRSCPLGSGLREQKWIVHTGPPQRWWTACLGSVKRHNETVSTKNVQHILSRHITWHKYLKMFHRRNLDRTRTSFGAEESVCLTSNFGRDRKIWDVLERARRNVKRGRKRLFVTPRTWLTRVLLGELDNTHLHGWILIKTLVLLAARKLNYFLLCAPPPPSTTTSLQFVNHLCIIIPVSKWLSCRSQAPSALALSWAGSRPVRQGTCHPDMMKVPSWGLRRDLSWPWKFTGKKSGHVRLSRGQVRFGWEQKLKF